MPKYEPKSAGSVPPIRLERAKIFNEGSSGIAPVPLYLDGKVKEVQDVPAIHDNTAWVEFDIHLFDAGSHQVAIGDTDYKKFEVTGSKPSIVFEELILSDYRILKDEKVRLMAMARNLDKKIKLYKPACTPETIWWKHNQFNSIREKSGMWNLSFHPGRASMRSGWGTVIMLNYGYRITR